MKTYNVGIIGFAHMHINSLAQDFHAHPQVKITAIADTIPLRPEMRDALYTRNWNIDLIKEKCGNPTQYADYREMLEKESFDIVISCAENARHAEVTEACAAKGIHVVVEKPMASSLAHGLRMMRAAEAAGTKLVVNWPTTWDTAIRAAQAVIESGEIGQVIEVKFRGGHRGPLGWGVSHPGVTEGAGPMTGPEKGSTWWHQADTGGGAMLDYCCYGSMLARWFVGEQALSAIGMKANLDSHWGDAEDNAAMLVRFPGAMGLFEGSWTTFDHGVSPGPIVYGTEGTLVSERKGEQMVRITKGGDDSRLVDIDPLPEGRTNIAEEFIHHLETGDPLHPTLQPALNTEVMAILDAGVRSAASGQLEMVNNGTWEIGR